MIWLGDGSGIAIYNGYNGDTHFLNAASSHDFDDTPPLTTPFSSEDLQRWLLLNDVQSEHAIKQLQRQKVIWKSAQ